eukprot:jgi/Psemu1/209419/e_gw1.499.8.1
MQKQEKISWKDTNLALIGSELDHKVKEAAAEGEEAWDGIGKEAGLRVWRIEKFRVQPWPEEQYGQFFKGDSYIVLHSYGSDPSALQHDVHIWIGSESTQDEYGTAAYKMVEADDFLGGAAVQHRQIEGLEADEFVDCFDFLEYLEGGIETGFTKVEPTEEKPLFFKFRVRESGNRSKKGELVQVPLSVSSMDSQNGFILYADKARVWAWHGSEMKIMEKVACTHQGEELCTMGTVTVLAQGHDDAEDDEFWSYLNQGEEESTEGAGASLSRSIGSAPTGLKPRASLVGKLTEFQPKIFMVPADPTEALQQMGLGSLIQKAVLKNPMGFLKKSSSILDENDVFLIDTGWKIFVWIGKHADPGEKVAALGAADRYADIEPRAKELPVTVLKSGQERGGFRAFFK